MRLRRSGPLPLLLALLAACATPAPGTAPHAAARRKAVFVIVDGIPADVIERVATPHLDAIAAAAGPAAAGAPGRGYTRATVGGEPGGPSETPTVSAPGYMSLLTGTWAWKHNVRGNSNQSPDYAYWNLFRIVETVEPARRTALFSTWLDNRTVLVGEGRPDAGNIRLDHVADGFEHDTARFPHDAASRHILAIDEHVTSQAARVIADSGPDLSWVYLQHTDDVGHAQGDSPAFDAAVRHADSLVGVLWRAVRQREALGERWMLVVTTDHGRDPISGRGHGRQTTRERTTWIVTNHDALGPRFTQAAPAIVDIAPSLLQHLGIAVPADVAAKFDGVSFLASRRGAP
jgi:predicted AlkP superfamily pyrophosphatase or phosphodiesterase